MLSICSQIFRYLFSHWKYQIRSSSVRSSFYEWWFHICINRFTLYPPLRNIEIARYVYICINRPTVFEEVVLVRHKHSSPFSTYHMDFSAHPSRYSKFDWLDLFFWFFFSCSFHLMNIDLSHIFIKQFTLTCSLYCLQSRIYLYDSLTPLEYLFPVFKQLSLSCL